jgi:hypothetical protein
MSWHPLQRRPSPLVRIGLCLATVPLGALLGAAPGEHEESPHGSPTGCASCHETVVPGTPVEAIVYTHGTLDETCLHCHEFGPHDVGMEPYPGGDEADEYAKLPADWPLWNGVVSCLTCHDEPACDGKELAPDNVRFYRGGAAASIGEFCARCHTVEQWQSYNPHEVMEERPGLTSVCEFCHQSATVTEADMDDLMVAAPRMCAGCHREEAIHASAPEHLVTLDAAGITRAADAGLPLDQGKVYCGTCHDPHPAGSIEANEDRVGRVGQPMMPADWADTVLAPAYESRSAQQGLVITPLTTEPDYLRHPLTGGELCKVCHLAADIDAGSGESTP